MVKLPAAGVRIAADTKWLSIYQTMAIIIIISSVQYTYACVFWSQSLCMRLAVWITTLIPSPYRSNIILLHNNIVESIWIVNVSFQYCIPVVSSKHNLQLCLQFRGTIIMEWTNNCLKLSTAVSSSLELFVHDDKKKVWSTAKCNTQANLLQVTMQGIQEMCISLSICQPHSWSCLLFFYLSEWLWNWISMATPTLKLILSFKLMSIIYFYYRPGRWELRYWPNLGTKVDSLLHTERFKQGAHSLEIVLCWGTAEPPSWAEDWSLSGPHEQ